MAGALGLLALAYGRGDVPRPGPAQGVAWKVIAPGLEMARARLPADPPGDFYPLVLVRVDPRRFDLRVLCARADRSHRARTAGEWSSDLGALAAINASMYMTDGLTSVSLLRTLNHVNNPALGRG